MSNVGMWIALVAVFLGCSTPSTPPSNAEQEPAPPIESDREDVQREFERALDYLAEQRWEFALDELRLLQSEYSGEPVAELAELYIARALLGDLDEQFDRIANDDSVESVEREVFSLLTPLAESRRVDERIRYAAQVYLAAAHALEADGARAVSTLADYPGASISPSLLDGDKRWSWSLIAEGLAGAERYAESVIAWGHLHAHLREHHAADPQQPVTEGADDSDESFGRPELPADAALAVNRAFANEQQLGEEAAGEFLASNLPLVRAVGAWTLIRRELNDVDAPMDDERIEPLQQVLNDVSSDFLTIGAPDRASELSVALASVLGPRRLVIGAALPLTGRNRAVGHRALAGMLVAQQAFHAAGEPTVTLVIKDSSSDVVAAYDRLVDQGASAVIGPLATDQSRQLIDAARQRDVPVISMAADRLRDGESGPVDENGDGGASPMFRNFVDAIAEARAAARIAFDEFEDRTAAVVYPDMGYGRALSQAFVQQFRQQGGQVVLEAEYDRAATDYVDLAEQVATASPDAVFLPDTGAKAAEISAFFAQEQIWGIEPHSQRPDDGRTHVHYLGTSLWQSPMVVEQADSYLRGALVPAWHSSEFNDAHTRQFVQSLRAIYDMEPDPFVAFAYDSVQTLRSLMLDHSVVEPTEVTGALRRDEWFRGATGLHRFGADGEPLRKLRYLTVDQEGWMPFDSTVATPLEGRDELEALFEEQQFDTIDEEPVDQDDDPGPGSM